MKLKKKYFCPIALIVILGILLFENFINAYRGEGFFFVVHLMHNRPSYAKKIEVKPYLLSTEQVADVIKHPKQEVLQPSQKELPLNNLYALIRFRDHSGLHVDGSMRIKVGEMWYRIDISPPPSYAKGGDWFTDVVIPVDLQPGYKGSLLPIKYKWDRVLVK